MAYFNQDSINRLNEIMEENYTEKGKPLKQADLHRITKVSKKHLSNILTDNKPLTNQTALKIVKAFPLRRYRVEWLMGEDDYKTEGDVFKAHWEELARPTRDKQAVHTAVASMMTMCGLQWDGDSTAHFQRNNKATTHQEPDPESTPDRISTVNYNGVVFETWELAAIADKVYDFLRMEIEYSVRAKKEKDMDVLDRQPVSIAFGKEMR